MASSSASYRKTTPSSGSNGRKSTYSKHSSTRKIKSETSARKVADLYPIHNTFPKKYDTIPVGDDVLKIVASVLSLEVESNQWEIRDREGDLVLVNYSDSADMRYHGFLCGIIVDLKRKIPVCASHGFVPTAVRDNIHVTSDKFAYTIASTDDNRYLLPVEDTVIRPLVNGTILRVFKHDGEVRISNHTHIDVGDRKWANSVPFLSMLHKVLPPKKLESLFPADVDNSPYCYVFAVASKDTVISNRYVFPTEDSVLVSLISVFQLWIPTDAAYPEKYTNPKYKSELKELQMLDIFHRPIVENKNDIWETWTSDPDNFYAPHFADVIEYTSDVNVALKKGLLYVPPILTQTEADLFLKHGFYPDQDFSGKDPKTTTGEAVVLITRSNRLVTNVLRVHSIASKWRTDIRQGDPNLFRRLLTMSMLLHTQLSVPGELQAYHNTIPSFDPKISPDELRKSKSKHGVILELPMVESSPKLSKDDMLRQICIAFAFSLPPSHQNAESFHFYEKFQQARSLVAKYLLDAYDSGVEPSYRGKVLTSGAVDLKVGSGNGDMLENLNIALKDEVGCSLYRLYLEAKRYFNKECDA
jgi:hypothetical protein